MEVGLTKYNLHNYSNRTQPNNFKSDRTNVGYNSTKTGNNISFQSRIEFIDSKTFEKLKMQLAKTGKGKKVEYGNNCQLYVLDDIIYTTEDIMTCTGGGFTDGMRKVLGFHWYDEKYQKADKWCNEVLNKLRKMASQKRNSSAH